MARKAWPSGYEYILLVASATKGDAPFLMKRTGNSVFFWDTFRDSKIFLFSILITAYV